MGLVAVREMARHRYRQSQLAGLTRHQLDEIAREREAQRQGAARATERADRSDGLNCGDKESFILCRR